MNIHGVDGIRISRRDFPAAKGDHLRSFTANEVTFFHEGQAFVTVMVYTDMGDNLLVNGGDSWGKTSDNIYTPVQGDVHVNEGEELSVQLVESHSWIHQFYVGMVCKVSVCCAEKLEFSVAKAVLA